MFTVLWRGLPRSLMMSALVAALAACNGDGGDSSGGGSSATVGGSRIEHIQVKTVDGSTVTGLLGYVPRSRPTRLVVFTHGLHHIVEPHWTQYVERTVRADTVVVTTNYRNNLEFPVLKGAQDTNAATQMALARFPSIETVYLLGVSMGGAVSGTAITESMKLTPDGSSLYDYWIDIEGVANLFESWLEATLVLPEIASQIEDDAGGTPLEVPQEYVRRSPALNAQQMKAGGIKAVALVYSVNDGLVPHNQGREMALALITAGIPVNFFLVTRDSDEEPSDTTLTGAFAGLIGIGDPNDLLGLNLAGHADEAHAAHPNMRVGFEQLELMLDGDYVPTIYSETLIDDAAGINQVIIP